MIIKFKLICTSIFKFILNFIKFDKNWYLSHYNDVNKSNMNPYIHYLIYGIKENRLHSELDYIKHNIDYSWYSNRYNIIGNQKNILNYHIQYGKEKGYFLNFSDECLYWEKKKFQ